MVEKIDSYSATESLTKGIMVVLGEIKERYGQEPKLKEPEIAIDLTLRYSSLRMNEAESRGDHDEAFKWKKAQEEPTRENKWILLKNLVKNFDLMLDSENGDGKREEYSRALQNLVDSF